MKKIYIVFALCAFAGALSVSGCGKTISDDIAKQEENGTKKKSKDSTETAAKKQTGKDSTEKSSEAKKSTEKNSADKNGTDKNNADVNIEINDNIYHYFGMGYDSLVSEIGTPSWDSGTEDWLGRQLVFDNGKPNFTMVPNYVDQVGEISGTMSQITNMKQSDVIQVADLVKMLGIESDLRYYVDEGLGDYSFGEGALVATGTNGDYLISVLFNENKSVTGTNDIFIKKMSLYEAGKSSNKQMTDEDVAKEVDSIRLIYNDIQEKLDNGFYSESICSISGRNIKLYTDAENKIVCADFADSNMPGYSCKLYYNAGNIMFAYYENPKGSSERLYFRNGNLFRWRHCEDSNDPDDAVNHDNEDSVDFRMMEKNVQELSKRINQAN